MARTVAGSSGGLPAQPRIPSVPKSLICADVFIPPIVLRGHGVEVTRITGPGAHTRGFPHADEGNELSGSLWGGGDSDAVRTELNHLKGVREPTDLRSDRAVFLDAGWIEYEVQVVAFEVLDLAGRAAEGDVER